MKRMNLFYSLVLAGFLATGYACLNDVPVFADELAETATEPGSSAEVTEETVTAESFSENASYESAAPVSEETDAPVSDANDASASTETEDIITESDVESVETVAAADQSTDTGASSQDSNHFETQEFAVTGNFVVSISADSNGDLKANITYDHTYYEEEAEATTNPYTLSYKIPSSWTTKQQEEFREIMESYVNYALSVSPKDTNILNFSGIKYVTNPDGTDTPQLTDADKFDDPVLVLLPHEITTLDGNHCWAASAANSLWTSGWAKQATNPLTGKVFASEDEVMTYFSSCFTDIPYGDVYGLMWFFNGTYQSMINGAVIEDRSDIYVEENALKGTEQHGLLTNYDLVKKVNGETLIDNAYLVGDYMENLEKIAEEGFAEKSYGLTIYLYQYNKENSCWVNKGGHAITIAGLLYDENEENLKDKFKGILVADSENDSYISINEQLYKPENAADATTKKSLQPNSYTLYKLAYATQKLDGIDTEFWYMPGYAPNADWLYVLEAYYYIQDCNEQTMKDYAITVNSSSETSSESSESSSDRVSSVVNESESVIDQLVKAARLEFQKDPELNKKSFILRGASLNDKKYLWETTYQLGKNWKYAFVANRALKLIGQITLDGKVLDPSEYTIISYDDVCVILFSADFMQNLSEGQHIFTFSCEGFDEPTQMSVVVE